MQEQTVQSYVRNISPNKHEANEVDNTMGMVIGASSLVALATVYWTITIVVLLIIGAAYGVKHIASTNPRATVIEAVTAPLEAPKVKRHYSARIKVNNYQTGKSVRV